MIEDVARSPGASSATAAFGSSGRTRTTSGTPGPASWSPAGRVRPAHARRPRSPSGSGPSLFGRPLASEEEIGERLTKKKALAIFSSDAISSSAYATEEILRVLVAGRRRRAVPVDRRSRSPSPCCWRSCRSPTARSATSIPSAAAPTPSRAQNLAPIFGLIAAAALLVDYVMTVAVSTTSAVEQVISLVPAASTWRVAIGVVAVP